MQRAIDETNRRRSKQLYHNEQNGIIPKTIFRSKEDILQASSVLESVRKGNEKTEIDVQKENIDINVENKEELLADLENKMRIAAEKLDFEKAAFLRDEISKVKEED